MTGPEHYREAERQLRYAKETESDSRAAVAAHLAQAHATLALAAATAFQPSHLGVNRAEWKAWKAAAWTKDAA